MNRGRRVCNCLSSVGSFLCAPNGSGNRLRDILLQLGTMASQRQESNPANYRGHEAFRGEGHHLHPCQGRTSPGKLLQLPDAVERLDLPRRNRAPVNKILEEL